LRSHWRASTVISKEEFDELSEVLRELSLELKGGALLIVEGPGDEKMVRESGLEGRLVTLSGLSRGALLELVETLQCPKVIILTDVDSEGRRIKKELTHLFRSRGVTVDETYWERVARVVRGRVCEIEALLKRWVRMRSNT